MQSLGVITSVRPEEAVSERTVTPTSVQTAREVLNDNNN
jgi:hypothetical protein